MKYTFSNLEQDTDKTKNNYDMLFDLTFSIVFIFFSILIETIQLPKALILHFYYLVIKNNVVD